MDILSDELSAAVFRRVVRKDLGEFSLNSQMLAILMELDGKERLASIAKKTGLDMPALKTVVEKLLKLKIIEPVADAVPCLNGDFLDCLRGELSLAVGPIAEILIEDAAADLGHDLSKFPTHRAAELVDLLAREIPKEDKKNVFKQQMVQQIKKLG